MEFSKMRSHLCKACIWTASSLRLKESNSRTAEWIWQNLILGGVSLKFVHPFQFGLKSDKHNRHFTRRLLYLSASKRSQINIVRKTKNILCCLHYFFPVILTVLEKIKPKWIERASIVTQYIHFQSCLHFLWFTGCHWFLDCSIDSYSF
jgi:hypothetical protein